MNVLIFHPSPPSTCVPLVGVWGGGGGGGIAMGHMPTPFHFSATSRKVGGVWGQVEGGGGGWLPDPNMYGLK